MFISKFKLYLKRKLCASYENCQRNVCYSKTTGSEFVDAISVMLVLLLLLVLILATIAMWPQLKHGETLAMVHNYPTMTRLEFQCD